MASFPLDASTWIKVKNAIQLKDLEAARSFVQPCMDLNLSMGIKGTPLCDAIEDGGTHLVKHLLQLGCNLNAKNNDGEFPLALAVRKKNFGIINLLIESNAIAMTDQRELGNILCDAVRFDLPSVVEMLLQHGVKVCAKNKDEDTGLHVSVSLGLRMITDILLLHGADSLMPNKNGDSCLHVATMASDLQAIQLIVEHQLKNLGSEDKNACILRLLNHKQTMTSYSLLHTAVTHDCVDIVKYLIEAGCDLDAKSKDGETPLSLACCDCNLGMVELLVDGGCNVNSPAYDRMQLRFRTLSSKTSPLLIAVCKGSFSIFKCLLEAGADINCVNEKENSSLSIALRLLCTDILDYILKVGPEKGLNLKKIIRKNKGRNPLLDVVSLDYDAPAIAEKLIALGCPLDCSGCNNFMSPLHAAVEMEGVELMRTFLKHGANMKLFDRDGNMPIHLCVLYDLDQALQVLLEYGADVNWRTRDGKCCLILALKHSSSDVVRCIIKAGHRLPVYPFLEDDESEQMEASGFLGPCESCSPSDFDCFYAAEDMDPELYNFMKSVCRVPPSLAEHSCRALRNYFIDNHILLNEIQDVELPVSLKDMLLRKDILF